VPEPSPNNQGPDDKDKSYGDDYNHPTRSSRRLDPTRRSLAGLQKTLGGPRLRSREERGRQCGHLDRSYKAISSADNRLDKTGPLRVIFKDLAKPANYGIDAVVDVEEDTLAPHPLSDLLPGHQLAWLLQQKQQQFHRDTRQSEWPVGSSKLIGADIELKLAAKSDQVRRYRVIQKKRKLLQ
jgi:hypothetical protein